MKRFINGKEIDQWAENIDKEALPEWYGDYDYDGAKSSRRYFKGAFIAKKYNAIIGIANELHPKIELSEFWITMIHENGKYQIKRDFVANNFLVPHLLNS